MDRFRALGTFLAAAETGAFNAAARQLGVSPPSVTRIVGELEEHLGARLFLRSTRALALTEAGLRLRTDARRILDDLAEAEAAAAGIHGRVAGTLRVTAPVLFGRMHLAPAIRGFLDAHRGMQVTALLLDRVVNLTDEGIDVALRIADLPDSGLTAVRIGTVRHVVVAAPELVARHGTPARPGDLADLPLIGAGPEAGSGAWRFERAGRAATIRFAPRFAVTGNDAALDAALAGWGAARLRSYQVAEHLAAGRLVELVPGADDRAVPVSLVHREGRGANARVRAFLDFAVPRLRAVTGLMG